MKVCIDGCMLGNLNAKCSPFTIEKEKCTELVALDEVTSAINQFIDTFCIEACMPQRIRKYERGLRVNRLDLL